MKHKCLWCENTGESGQAGILDCAQPNCTAAADRHAMNEFVANLKHATDYDIHWAIHQRATEIAEQKAAQSFANQTLVVSIPRRRKEDQQKQG